MKNKKLLMTMLALILVCSISVAGTLAFLTASQNGEKTVVNTFLAAGDGNIIDPTPIPDAPENPDVPELQDGFFLVESEATYADAKYTVDENSKVIANTYDKVVPGMLIPKDPALTVDLATGIDAYIFVKVIDTTYVDKNTKNFTYDIATSYWTEISVDGLSESEKVYVYKNAITTGKEGTDLNEVPILTEKTKTDTTGTVKYQLQTADTLVDTDGKTEGVQLGEGKLKFEAYACQAGGFTSAADAFKQCFMTTTP